MQDALHHVVFIQVPAWSWTTHPTCKGGHCAYLGTSPCQAKIVSAVLFSGLFVYLLFYKIKMYVQIQYGISDTIYFTIQHTWAISGPGGIRIWFWRWCAADDAKPLPVFRGHFGWKWYPFLGIFSRKFKICGPFLGIFPKIWNFRPVFRDFIPKFSKNGRKIKNWTRV